MHALVMQYHFQAFIDINFLEKTHFKYLFKYAQDRRNIYYIFL